LRADRKTARIFHLMPRPATRPAYRRRQPKPLQPLPVQIVNTMHQTRIYLRQRLGDEITPATLKRVRRILCPVAGCSCKALTDCSVGSAYTISPAGVARYRLTLTPPSGPSR
jgi:hypothetical protein